MPHPCLAGASFGGHSVVCWGDPRAQKRVESGFWATNPLGCFGQILLCSGLSFLLGEVRQWLWPRLGNGFHLEDQLPATSGGLLEKAPSSAEESSVIDWPCLLQE